AWSIARASHAEWPINDDAVDAATDIECRIGAEVRVLLVDAGPSGAVDDGCADGMRPRQNRKPETAGISHIDFFSVDRDVHTTATLSTTDGEFVFCIQWKRVLDEHATA